MKQTAYIPRVQLQKKTQQTARRLVIQRTQPATSTNKTHPPPNSLTTILNRLSRRTQHKTGPNRCHLSWIMSQENHSSPVSVTAHHYTAPYSGGPTTHPTSAPCHGKCDARILHTCCAADSTVSSGNRQSHSEHMKKKQAKPAERLHQRPQLCLEHSRMIVLE